VTPADRETRLADLVHLAAELEELAGPAAWPTLSLDVSDEATDTVAALPGAEVGTTVYLSERTAPYAIDHALVRVGRVTIRAQRPGRPATPTELAALDNETAHDHAPMRTARVTAVRS
jgi:hypothetical protein